MAYSKKASRRYRRGSYNKRSYYRRRYRRRYYRKGLRRRRFPRKVEVKVQQKSVSNYWELGKINQSSINSQLPYYECCLGRMFCFPTSTDKPYTMVINQGAGSSQRVGAKIKPIKLRLTGSLAFEADSSSSGTFPNLAQPYYASNQGPAEVQYTMGRDIPFAFQLRCIVYQVKGGNTVYEPDNPGYHPLTLNPVSSSVVYTFTDNVGNVFPQELCKLLGNYSLYTARPQNFDNNTLLDNLAAGKTPLRLGIGGQFKMLYTKTFTLQTGYKTSIPFRFVTRVPRRIVYPETPTGDKGNTTQNIPRNAIYIVWLLVPQGTNMQGRIILNYQTQLFYTDS